jgi:FOG: WD40 repeat
MSKLDLEDPEFIKKQKELLRMTRFPDTECRLPEEVLYRFPSADLGCFRLAFSPNGRYLAAACTYANSKTVIKIYNVEDGVLKYTIKAHKNIVHDIDFTPNSLYLVTCSSDFTAKLWKLPYPELNDEIEEDDSEKYMHVCTLLHPSYVYGAKFFIDEDESRLIIATACFDTKVRFWRVDFEYGRYSRHDVVSENVVSYDGVQPDKFVNLLEHRHPNCLKFDNQGRLYIGDSIGCVHVWDIQVMS